VREAGGKFACPPEQGPESSWFVLEQLCMLPEIYFMFPSQILKHPYSKSKL